MQIDWRVVAGLIGALATFLVAYSRGLIKFGKTKGTTEVQGEQISDLKECLREINHITHETYRMVSSHEKRIGELEELEESWKEDHERLIRIEVLVQQIYNDGSYKDYINNDESDESNDD